MTVQFPSWYETLSDWYCVTFHPGRLTWERSQNSCLPRTCNRPRFRKCHLRSVLLENLSIEAKFRCPQPREGVKNCFTGRGVGTTQYGSISVKMFFDTVPYLFLTNYFHSLGILWQAEGFHRLPKSSQLFKRGSSPQARPCWQVYKFYETWKWT